MTMPRLLQRFVPGRLAARLTLLVSFTAALSVTIAASSMLFMGWRAAESKALNDARDDARAMAFSLAAPLAFQDRASTREVLALLSRRPDVLAVWVRSPEGRLLHSQGVAGDLVRDGGGLRQGEIVVTEPVHAGRGEDLIGTLSLRIDLSGAREELRSQAVAAAIASLVALALTVMLSRQMARRMSVPVVQLAEAAAALTRDWSRPARLSVTGPGEIGVALAAYNHMVDQLCHRDAAVQKLTDELRDTAAAADAARQQAESASVAKTRFLANMSHELRSPLNGVIGAAQLLQKSHQDPAFRQELIRIIQTSGSNLLDLIEGVLDVSRIEAGRLKTDRQPFDLLHCVEAALAPAVAGAALKTLNLECHIDADVPGWCMGDEARLKQLLQNLLGNAVKFSDAGTVSLTVTGDPGSNDLLFAVEDTGPGIPAHQLESIFEPFQQGDASTTRRYGGSGLGLTICREIARLMDGDVSVQSTLGVGSRFTLRLPLARIPHTAGKPALLGQTVKCYEPVEIRRRSIAALLQRLGCRVEFLADLPAIRAAMAQSRSPGGRTGAWLIAAETAEGMAALKEARAAGIPGVAALGKITLGRDAHYVLSRPVTCSALRALLTGKDAKGDVQSMPETVRRQALRERVLLVEDDRVNQLVVSAMIEGREFQCVVAANGAEALRLLRSEHFDAVLMDWHMPDMDGLEVTRHLRAGACGELNRAVPVIALTANAFAEDRTACLAAGMNDFLTKPVQAQALLQCVQRWCRSISPGADEPAPALAVPNGATEVPAYDPDILGALCIEPDGSSSVKELLELFCSNVQSTLLAMDAAVESNDWRTLQRQAHTLKGSAGQVGAMVLSRQASALESRLRSGVAGCAGDVALLREAFAQFAKAAAVVAAAA
jgi:signal transduction histidine kinase/CheY-like chemotaxis protein/HPt (histidine-containing phosphotransfer) domain-containing protein